MIRLHYIAITIERHKPGVVVVRVVGVVVVVVGVVVVHVVVGVVVVVVSMVVEVVGVVVVVVSIVVVVVGVVVVVVGVVVVVVGAVVVVETLNEINKHIVRDITPVTFVKQSTVFTTRAVLARYRCLRVCIFVLLVKTERLQGYGQSRTR